MQTLEILVRDQKQLFFHPHVTIHDLLMSAGQVKRQVKLLLFNAMSKRQTIKPNTNASSAKGHISDISATYTICICVGDNIIWAFTNRLQCLLMIGHYKHSCKMINQTEKKELFGNIRLPRLLLMYPAHHVPSEGLRSADCTVWRWKFANKCCKDWYSHDTLASCHTDVWLGTFILRK